MIMRGRAVIVFPQVRCDVHLKQGIVYVINCPYFGQNAFAVSALPRR